MTAARSWDAQSSGTTHALNAVSFSDATHGWAVGDGATILATSDGGATWTRQGWEATNTPLYGVASVDDLHAWAVGGSFVGTILATNSGGIAPPSTVASGAVDRVWYNHTLSITLTASAGANPVASIDYVLNGAPQSVAGTSATVTIPADAATHVNDGVNVLVYTASDTLGLTQFSKTLAVNIDTRKPVVKAPYAASAARGKTATLKYKVSDAKPNAGSAAVTIRIKNRANKVVKTMLLGRKPVSSSAVRTAKFGVPKTWKAGTYRFFVYATDTAGNQQASVASNKLRVK